MSELAKEENKALVALNTGTELPPCRGYHAQALGLPCAHRLAALIRNRMPIQQQSVDRFWWLADPAAEPVRLLDPVPARPRGRPLAQGGRRELVAFELAERAEHQARRRCGICRQPGHNRTTCPNQPPAQR